MPHVLTDLDLDEVSVVDNPSNAETINGRKIPRARIAFFKFDNPSHLSEVGLRKFMDRLEAERQAAKRETKKMSKFQNVLKSASTRSAIAEAVERKAQKIAKRDGVSMSAALAKAWEQSPEAIAKYEATPKDEPKRAAEPKMFRCTKAEAELDHRARKLMTMSKPSLSYAQACSKALTDDPALYTKYQNGSLRRARTYVVPVPSDLNTGAGSLDFLSKSARRKATADAGNDEGPDPGDDDGECPSCGEDVDDGDAYCSSCGASPLDTEKSKRKSRVPRF